MYQYCKKTFGQPVYLCTGDEAEEFRKDVEAVGLYTELLDSFERSVVLAVDPLYEDRHLLALNQVKEEIAKYGGLGPDVENALIDGPFPKTREFPVYTVWQMWGVDHVEAATLQEAMDEAIRNRSLPDGDYVSESQEIDYDTPVDF